MMFLFSSDRSLLAEIALERGSMRQIILTGAGERTIGPSVSHWQTRGIPVPNSIGGATYYEHVQPRDGKFADALTDWANMHGYCTLEVENNVIPLWEELTRLPLESSERFSFLLAIRLTPPSALAEWKSCLDEAELAWTKQTGLRRKQATVESIKKKMEPHLTRPFKASSRVT